MNESTAPSTPSTPSTPSPQSAASSGTRTRRRAPKACAWCGKQLGQVSTGRPRKFCCAACRQRAYEQRQQLKGTGIPADAVIMPPEVAARFQDELFELRCAAEDILTAAREGEPAEEIAELADEVVGLAKRLEKIRGQQ